MTIIITILLYWFIITYNHNCFLCNQKVNTHFFPTMNHILGASSSLESAAWNQWSSSLGRSLRLKPWYQISIQQTRSSCGLNGECMVLIMLMASWLTHTCTMQSVPEFTQRLVGSQEAVSGSFVSMLITCSSLVRSKHKIWYHETLLIKALFHYTKEKWMVF